MPIEWLYAIVVDISFLSCPINQPKKPFYFLKTTQRIPLHLYDYSGLNGCVAVKGMPNVGMSIG